MKRKKRMYNIKKILNTDFYPEPKIYKSKDITIYEITKNTRLAVFATGTAVTATMEKTPKQSSGMEISFEDYKGKTLGVLTISSKNYKITSADDYLFCLTIMPQEVVFTVV